MLARGLEEEGVGQEVTAEQGPGRFQIRAVSREGPGGRGSGHQPGRMTITVISGQGLWLIG